MTNCEFCNKEINNKGGLIKHQNGCKLNPNRKNYKSNLIDYHEKVKNGDIERKYINGIDKNKKLGLPIPESWKQVPDRTGSKLSNETKSKLSKARSKIIEENGNGGFKHIKWYEVNNIVDESFIVRGTYELRLSKELNNAKIYWVRKKYLDYEIDGQIRTYCPDFYIPHKNVFIEVKGYYSEKDKNKMKAVEKYNNIKIFLIFEKDLITIEKNGFDEYMKHLL
jgi:hypothetical protein